MRLGVFGGSFDPVHYGHLLLAECCREQCPLDQVWFVPAAVPPHKQGRVMTPGAARIEMLELAIAGHSAFSVSRYEVDRGGINYTVETLAHFHKEMPGSELFFLLGADMLCDLPHWREAGKVCELATLVVAGRPGLGPLNLDCLSAVTTPERIEAIGGQRVEMPEIGISSTELRQRVARGQSIRYQTPAAVVEYIRSRGLYREGDVGCGVRGVACGVTRIPPTPHTPLLTPSRGPARLEQILERLGHGQVSRRRLATEHLQDLIEVVRGGLGQVEKQEFFAFDLTGPATGPRQPFLTDHVS
jgi:nicotinate-nucleotide adenylyltransferase